ncbi:histidine phosphatase family protein [Campylobacter sp. 9BO]|uniref:SixA phosphatase family protein n=1 Tax=Campylobacter sp. 9BO TaxID=3424759 RepID=UPI003D349616
MGKIYFMRHAKAEEKKDSKKDFTRELSNRGKEDLKLMAKVLKELKVGVDAVFYSEATRCEQSAKKLCEMMKFKKKPKSVKSFYNAGSEEILEFVRSLDERLNEIFIIAHNPAITEICELLSDSVIGNIPTSGIFALEFEQAYKEANEGCAKILFFEYPKKYKK